MKHQDQNFKRRGQIMLLSIMVLGGVMIGSTALAGLIFIMQRQQVTDAVVSARALAAADSGMEHINFLIYKEESVDCLDNNRINSPLAFETGETFYRASCELTPTFLRIFAEGFSRDVTRVLETVLTE